MSDPRYQIDVSVVTRYLKEQSDPENSRFAFAYTITVQNNGSLSAKLLSRHWLTTNGDGEVEEVRGAGVVGQQPNIDPGQSHDRFGVYAGNANNGYTAALRHAQPELVQQFGEFGVMLGAEKDYIATRVANRLNLNGPALSIHTACSTSLVAITQAWHGLATGQRC